MDVPNFEREFDYFSENVAKSVAIRTGNLGERCPPSEMVANVFQQGPVLEPRFCRHRPKIENLRLVAVNAIPEGCSTGSRQPVCGEGASSVAKEAVVNGIPVIAAKPCQLQCTQLHEGPPQQFRKQLVRAFPDRH